MYFVTEEAKKKVLDFSEGSIKLLWFYFVLMQYYYEMAQYNILDVKY